MKRGEGAEKPRVASTVILLRNGRSGVEVFMMKRHIRSDFVGGAHVFPGGAVDAADRIEGSICSGHDDQAASRILGVSRGGLAYWVAAIRECFEEAGVLLAYAKRGGMLAFDDPSSEARYRRYRDALNQGSISLREIVRREELRLATDRVHYWAHWVTPEGQPIRYDTRFFLALAPDAQTAAHDGWELTESAWVRPQTALDRARAGEWTIIFPTLRNLEALCEFSTAEAAEEAARARPEVSKVQPRVVKDARGIHILIPGDPGYEEAGEPLDATAADNYTGIKPAGEEPSR